MKTITILLIIIAGLIWWIFSPNIIILGYFVGVIVGILVEKFSNYLTKPRQL